ncbi:peptidylprolyl isomerase [Myxococcota bacterium]
MDRSTSLALGGLSTAALAFLLFGTCAKRPNGSVVLGARRADIPPSWADADVEPSGLPRGSALAPSDLELDGRLINQLGDVGTPAALPSSAPSSVEIGVVQFTYRGAELAPRDARSKPEALRLARETLDLARRDFGAAVRLGDPGSAADIGDVPRGVLEPPIQYVLFTMKPDTVHRVPLDTPRGYWIVRRNH